MIALRNVCLIIFCYAQSICMYYIPFENMSAIMLLSAFNSSSFCQRKFVDLVFFFKVIDDKVEYKLYIQLYFKEHLLICNIRIIQNLKNIPMRVNCRQLRVFACVTVQKITPSYLFAYFHVSPLEKFELKR